jgi:peptide/nickel transport system substrate-binding protein
VRLVPFTEHPRRKPILTEVIVRNVPEPSARVAGLRTGDLDFSLAIPFDQIDVLKNAGVETYSVDFGQSGGFKIDTLSDTPMKDKRVRQALNYAVNKDLIVERIYRGYTRPEQGQILQPEVFGFNPNLKPYPYNPTLAKQLLAQAGYPNGFKTTMEAYVGSRPEVRDIGIVMQSQFREIGVETDYTPVTDFALWSDKFYGRTDRAPILGTGLNLVPAMDPDFGLVWFKSTQAEGLRYYNRPDFDAAYEASTREMDQTKRRDLVWRMLDIMYEDPPYLFVTQVAILLAHGKKIQGIEKRFDQDPLLEKVWVSA